MGTINHVALGQKYTFRNSKLSIRGQEEMEMANGKLRLIAREECVDVTMGRKEVEGS